MRRLQRINVTVVEKRPLVDMLTTSPTDPHQLDPIKNELTSVHRLSDDVSIRVGSRRFHGGCSIVRRFDGLKVSSIG